MPGPYPIQTLSVTIDATGISTPTFEDILASLTASYQQIYGSDTYLEPDSQDGQWIAIQAEAINDSNQALVAGYLAYSPSTAQGVGLSSIVKINGIARRTPSYSTVEVRIVGQAGTVIEEGIVSDTNLHQWDLPAEVIIPLDGEITVTAVCRDLGAVTAAPDTVVNIVTMQPGWQTVTNPLSAFKGAPLEGDAALRRRQTFSTNIVAITPRESIQGVVANLPGVGRTIVNENDTDFYSDEGIPPHSIAVVVESGDAAEIAEAIAIKKNVGCGTFGDMEYTYYDSHGVPLIVNWFYLREVPIFVTVRIDALPGYVATTAELISRAITAAVQNTEIGEEVYTTRLIAPANLSGADAVEATGIPQGSLDRLSFTYVVREIFIGTSANPTTSDDITIDYKSAASCNISNVTVVVPFGA